MTRNLSPNHWRNAIDKNHIMASAHTIKDSTNHKIVHQHLLSTVFEVTEKKITVASDVQSNLQGNF